ncbi:hypothetical protein HC864_03595 [Candidatus Gracilibacteria bacterium]|nr:hypothetical protein [Candidatus Gracilibacteria bacterium]
MILNHFQVKLLGYTLNKPIINYDRFNDITSFSILESDFVGLKTWYFKGQVGSDIFKHLQQSYNRHKEVATNSNFQISKHLPQHLLYSETYQGYRKVAINKIFDSKYSLTFKELEVTTNSENPRALFKFMLDEIVGKHNSHPDILETSIDQNIIQDSANSEFFFSQLSSYKEQRGFAANSENTQILNRKKEYNLAKLQHEKLANNIQNFSRENNETTNNERERPLS